MPSPKDTTLNNIVLQAPTLIGGVSRQPEHLRHPNQVADAVNAVFTIGDGCGKRPGSRLLSAVTGLTPSGNYRLHGIERDATERYLVLYGEGTIRVFDLAGVEITVFIDTAANTYLTSGGAEADDLRLVTIADFTFVLNTLVVPKTKTAAEYAITGVHRDFDTMISTVPANNTYHKTKEATPVQPAGFWQYTVTAADNGFAKFTGRTNGGAWGTYNGDWDMSARNPMGFDITFRDRSAVDTTYKVRENFYESPATSMEDLALRLQRALQNAGAADALIAWERTGAEGGRFIITSPHRGSGTTIVNITDPADAFSLAANGLNQPFYLVGGVVTAGSGTPSVQTLPVLSRWQRVPPSDQATAELDASTMPVQMRRLKAPYYSESVKAGSPFAYYRLGETTGTVAANEVSSASGTYVNTPTGNVTGALAGDSNRAVTFAAAQSERVDLGTLSDFGSRLGTSGASFEFWVKTTTQTTSAMMGNVAAAASNSFAIEIHGSVLDRLRARAQDSTGKETRGYASIAIDDGQWHHVVVYMKPNSNSIRIWMDNVERGIVYEAQTSPVVGNFTNAVWLAGSQGFMGYFSGSLDEVAFYEGMLPTKTIEEHYKRGKNATVFDIDLVEWGFRQNGGEDSNPPPSIFQKAAPLADIGFHRNRLVLAGDENIVFSQAGAFFDFYISDAQNIVESDPIDVALSSSEVTLVDFVVPFHKSLVIFTTAGRQFELSAPEALTPDTAAISESTAYDSLSVRPQPLGHAVYFVAQRQNAAQLYEYFYDDSRVSNFAADLTAQVHDYLPLGIRSIAVSPNNNAVFVLPTNGNSIYRYDFYWSGSQKLQSAWGKHAFHSFYRISDMALIDNDLFMLVESSGLHTLEAMSVSRELPVTGWPFVVHLDRKALVTGAYNAGTGETTFTQAVADAAIDTIVLGPAFGANAGEVLTPVRVTSTTVKLTGNYSAGQVALGRKFTMTVELSRPFLRGEDNAAQINGKLVLHYMITYHRNTGEYSVRVTQPGRAARTRTFKATGNGIATAGRIVQWIKGDAKDARVFIETASPRPCVITAMDYVADFTPGSP